jgi:hypothetical protein
MGEKRMIAKKLGLVLSVFCILGIGRAAEAQWHFGIGAGVVISSYQGDVGFNSPLAGGPVMLDVDLSPDDFADYTESAFGLGAFAINGRWRFEASFGFLSLEDDPSTMVGNAVLTSEITFDKSQGDFTVGYAVIQDGGFVFRPYTGVRYIGHELESKVRVNGVTRLTNDIDEDWADALIGIAMDIPIGNKVSWGTKFDAGFGGSEGSYLVNSGLTFNITKHWFTTLYGQYYEVEYENGSRGEADWYLYDVGEATGGVKIGYKW